MSFSAYPNYKSCDLGELTEVPDHWRVTRLKQACSIFASNVDKKSLDGQEAVRLCNYVNVYYNDLIEAGLPFMEATATDEQIARFTLRSGDTIITKDSETADDIARSAYVPETLGGVVCGYHLSMVRPTPEAHGPFIKRFFDAAYARAYFLTAANGLTRVGLGQYALDNAPLALPPYPEQVAIAAFLDRETAKIDALVEEQRCLIALLKEKRQAVISHAVTKGLNPDAPMKDSGVEWLGEVPAHWDVGPLKRYVENLDGRRIPLSSEERSHRSGPVPYYGASGIIDHIDEHIFDEDLVLVSEDGANLVNRSTPIAFVATGMYWVNNHAHILKPHDGRNIFWAERVEAINLTPVITGAAQPKLTADALANLRVAVPPSVNEREQIETAIDQCRNASDPLLAEARRAILLLTERRSTLISLAVTGKIDVRDSAKVLPFPVGRARARGLIAAEIIERSAQKATFGRVKLQKIAYLAEAHAGIAELEGDYLREAAGPLDRDMIREMEREAGALAGVRIEQPDGAGSAVTYRLGDRRGAHRQDLVALLGDRATKFDRLVEDTGTIETKGAEAVATLYAVWNDALIDGETPADMEIKLAVLSEWHPEKAEKFTINELQIWLDWMRRHGLVPTGAGPKTTTGRLFA